MVNCRSPPKRISYRYFCRRGVPNVLEARVHKGPPQNCSVEPLVEDTLVVVVEQTIVQVQIAKAQMAAGGNRLVEPGKNSTTCRTW